MSQEKWEGLAEAMERLEKTNGAAMDAASNYEGSEMSELGRKPKRHSIMLMGVGNGGKTSLIHALARSKAVSFSDEFKAAVMEKPMGLPWPPPAQTYYFGAMFFGLRVVRRGRLHQTIAGKDVSIPHAVTFYDAPGQVHAKGSDEVEGVDELIQHVGTRVEHAIFLVRTTDRWSAEEQVSVFSPALRALKHVQNVVVHFTHLDQDKNVRNASKEELMTYCRSLPATNLIKKALHEGGIETNLATTCSYAATEDGRMIGEGEEMQKFHRLEGGLDPVVTAVGLRPKLFGM